MPPSLPETGPVPRVWWRVVLQMEARLEGAAGETGRQDGDPTVGVGFQPTSQAASHGSLRCWIDRAAGGGNLVALEGDPTRS
jgi:hypothetical protein